MKSYDDLQRFKEKTQTNHIEFKDMSEHTKNSDSADWVIIKQLMNDSTTPALGNGQTINVAAPQPIAEDAFSLDTAPLQARPHTPSPVSVPRTAVFVAAQPADVDSRSLLESISASLKAMETSIPSAEVSGPHPAASEAGQAHAGFAGIVSQSSFTAAEQAPTDIFSQLQKSEPQNLTLFPVAQPASLSAGPAACHTGQMESPRFRQLFSTAPESSQTLSKDTLLQPLLERIASCR